MGREKRDHRDKGLRDEGLEISVERRETMRQRRRDERLGTCVQRRGTKDKG
jgi:hypothetical protein